MEPEGLQDLKFEKFAVIGCGTQMIDAFVMAGGSAGSKLRRGHAVMMSIAAGCLTAIEVQHAADKIRRGSAQPCLPIQGSQKQQSASTNDSDGNSTTRATAGAGRLLQLAVE